MSRRLNKRQQREMEELEALGGPSLPANDSEESEEEIVKPAKSAGAFAALMGDMDDAGVSESDDDKPRGAKGKKTKKKKKKAAAPIATETSKPQSPLTPKPVPTPTAKSEKKALKKAKAKEKKAADDELEQALKELSVKYPTNERMNQKTSSGQTFSDLISVSAQYLDPEVEMKKFFGAKVVQASKASGSASVSLARRQGAAVRSTLTRPQPGWWPAKQREGLSIRPLEDRELPPKLRRHGWDPVQGEKWWTVEYTKRYKALTKVFMRTVASGDPQGFWDLLSKSPYHADTLLQVSEVYRHREEHAQAVDFVDRALFTYERAFVGAFNLTNGSNRLDFDRVENRPFFLALHRQVVDLQRRGCVRTAFEFAKLLYSLDPWSDPHGSLFHLDHLAIRAGIYEWIVDLHELFAARRAAATSRPDARIDPSVLPSLTYTKALALRLLGKMEASTEVLKTALHDFPSVLPLLADKLDVILPVAIRSHPDFKIETDANSLCPEEAALHLSSHLYVQRSHQLWKDHASWLSETAVQTFEKLPTKLPITPRRGGFLRLYENASPRYAAYRHLIVLETEHRNLFPFIPRIIQQTRSLACDPLPPPTCVNNYDDDFFEGIDDLLAFRQRTRRERAQDERRLAQMVPDGAFRQQLEAWFNNNRALQDRFQGGIVHFAQAIAQLPPDMLEDMMLADAMGAEAGVDGMMPGGFGDMGMHIPPRGPGVDHPVHIEEDEEEQVEAQVEEQDDYEEEEDDEDDDEEEYSPLPQAIRNIFGRLWGRRAAEEDTSEEEEEVERPLLDTNGVD